MQTVLNGTQMKAADRYNIETIGIPSLVLMERAALAIAQEAEKRCVPGGRITVFCGYGNNGADGLAAARMLSLHGYSVQVILVGDTERATLEWQVQKTVLDHLGGIPCTESAQTEYPVKESNLIIDALFGIGLTRSLSGAWKEAAEQINGSGVPVLAADIPSGIHAGTGQVLGTAVKADITVTFGYEKLGLLLYPGAAYAGDVVTADCGFVPPPELLKEEAEGRLFHVFEPGETGRIPKRRPDGNKGTFGKVLLIAGSVGMCGAAYLSGLAAYRCGAGLVRVVTPRENIPVIQTLLPQAVVTSYDGAADREVPEAEIREWINWADSVVIGPGLSKGRAAEAILRAMLTHRDRKPTVLDADALNLLAEHQELLEELDQQVILTPHQGELSRLLGVSITELKKDPVRAAEAFYQKTGAVCVMKDARTLVISEKQRYLNRSGNDGMAAGGAGDVLTGILGALLASGMETAQAAETGVWLHGLAGDLAAKRFGRHAMTAKELADSIGEILKTWEEEQ